MKILVLMGAPHHIAPALEFAGRAVTLRRLPGVATVSDDGTEVVFRVVQREQDVEALRGARFDLILEHETFNVRRSPDIWRLAELAKVLVLR